MKTSNKSVPISDVKLRTTRFPILLGIFLIVLLGSTGCGLFASNDEADTPLAIRTVHPTFTPTSPATPIPAQQATAIGDQAQSTPDPAGSEQLGASKAVINGPLVNARSGPGTDFDILAEVERGEEFDIIGVSLDRAWWQICCIDGAQAWVTSEFVDTLGMVDSVPVIGADGQVQANEPQPAVTEPTPPSDPAANVTSPDSFTLETQEQFPETALVRIFLYAYSGNSALEGYSLSVTKDGAPLPVDGQSFGGQPAFTWPFQDPRQRFQNFKVDFPDTPAQGVWQVQLIDSSGATVGPAATFTLSANDPSQELYVRYAKQ